MKTKKSEIGRKTVLLKYLSFVALTLCPPPKIFLFFRGRAVLFCVYIIPYIVADFKQPSVE